MQAKTLKAISLLLHYPDQALLDHLDELKAATDAESAMKRGRLDAALEDQFAGGAFDHLDKNRLGFI